MNLTTSPKISIAKMAFHKLVLQKLCQDFVLKI